MDTVVPGQIAYRPAQTARALGISRSQTYELLRRGELPYFKSGSATLIPRSALDQWVAQQMEGRPA